MSSKHKEIQDFFPNKNLYDFNIAELGNSPGMDNYTQKFYSGNNQINQQQPNSNLSRLSKDPISNFLPNFILNDISKENKEEAFNKNSISSKINGQNFFFQDYDDDSENEDNQRLIINTINNLENLDDSNNFENIIFANSRNNNNLEVNFFFCLSFFLKFF